MQGLFQHTIDSHSPTRNQYQWHSPSQWHSEIQTDQPKPFLTKIIFGRNLNNQRTRKGTDQKPVTKNHSRTDFQKRTNFETGTENLWSIRIDRHSVRQCFGFLWQLGDDFSLRKTKFGQQNQFDRTVQEWIASSIWATGQRARL
jgi:hypothetical protein